MGGCSNCSLGEVKLQFLVPSGWIAENRDDLTESATPGHDAQVVWVYQVLNPVHQTVLTAKSRITLLPHNTFIKKHFCTMNEMQSCLI